MFGWVKVFQDPYKRLAELKKGVRNKILRKAVRAGSRVVSKAVKPHVPKLSGALRRSISVKIAMSKRTGAIYAIIGPRRRFVFKKKGETISTGSPTKYAHLVERGTRPHSLRGGHKLGAAAKAVSVLTARRNHNLSSGIHPGTRPHPFLRPAWIEAEAEAMAAMRRTIKDELRKL